MLTFVLFAPSFENTALKEPRSVQADLFDFVVPAWSDGTQADMDVSERILAELDAGHPCRHDDDVGERSIMNHFVVNFFRVFKLNIGTAGTIGTKCRVACALLFSIDSPTTQLMKVVRIYTGADNESHFEDIEVELNLRGNMEVSEVQPVNGIFFRRVPPTHRSNYHPAPRRQYVVTLAGQVEIETGDGTVRRFGP